MKEKIALGIMLILLLISCAQEGVGRTEYTVVPNETPPFRMETIPIEQLSTTAEIKAELQRIAEAEAKAEKERLKREAEQKAKAEKQSEEKAKGPNIRRPRRMGSSSSGKEDSTSARDGEPDNQLETAQDYRDRLLGGDPLEDFPHPDEVEKRRKQDYLLKPGKSRTTRKEKDKAQASKPQQRIGGGQIFQVINEETSMGSYIPPGQFFRARLLGNVNVTAVGAPVFAEIQDPETGEPIGIAVGTANLQGTQNDRAVIQFSAIHLDEGETVTGGLQAFESDLSQGLLGRVEQRSLAKVVNSIAETALAALSLEVDTGSDFGSVFQFQLADRLMRQAQERVDDIDLERVLFLQRDTHFWVASTQESNTRKADSRNLLLDAVTRRASANLGTGERTLQRDAVFDAYQRLNDKLKQVSRTQ